MTKKLLVLLVIFGLAASTALAAYWPAKSTINPLSTALYAINNYDTPAKVMVYPRNWAIGSSCWTTYGKMTITLPAGKCYGTAVSPDGKKLYIGVNDAQNNNTNTQILVYDLDKTGMPGNSPSATLTGFSSSQSNIVSMACDDFYLYVVDNGINNIHVFTINNNQYAGKITDKLNGDASPFNSNDNLEDITVTRMTPDRMPIIFISAKNTNRVYVFSDLILAFKPLGKITDGLFCPSSLSVSNDGKYLAVAVNKNTAASDTDVTLYNISQTKIDSLSAPKVKEISCSQNSVPPAAADYWTSVAFSPNCNTIYFTNNKKLYKVYANTIQLPSVVSNNIGAFPEGLAADPAGAKIVVAYSNQSTELTNIIEYDTGNATITAPVIDSVTPSSMSYGENKTITINGRNFFSGNPPITITYVTVFGTSGGKDLKNLVITPTKITGTLDLTADSADNMAAGPCDIEIGTAVNKSSNLVTEKTKIKNVFTVNFSKPVLFGKATIDGKSTSKPLTNPGGITWGWECNPAHQGQTVFEVQDYHGAVKYTTPNSTTNIWYVPASQEYNKKCDYKVVIKNGSTSQASNLVTAYTLANQPSNLKGIIDGNKIHVSWSANGNPDGTTYGIWRVLENAVDPLTGKPLPELPMSLAKVTANSYDIENISSNTKYIIRVTGINGDNIENGWMMPEITVTTGTVKPNEPPKPFELISPNNEIVKTNPVLTWNAANDTDDSADSLTYKISIYTIGAHNSKTLKASIDVVGKTTLATSHLTTPGYYGWDATVTDGKHDPVANSNGTLYFTVVADNGLTPEVVSTIPTKDAVNVNLNQDIIITFSEAMKKQFDPILISPAVVINQISWSADQKTATIKHAGFDADKKYTVEIDPQDLYGHSIKNNPYSWSFTTGSGGTGPSEVQLNLIYNQTIGNIYWISVPYTNEYQNAAGLVAAINAQLTADPASSQYITSIGRWDGNTQLFESYDALDFFGEITWSGTNFSLKPGESVYINIAKDITNVKLVGSFNNDYIFTPVYHSEKGNIYWVSLPYAASYSDAASIIADVNAKAGLGVLDASQITSIGRWDGKTQLFESYDALDFFGEITWSGKNFTFTPGEGYYINIGKNLNWSPKFN